jgi:hypothetical protein
MRALAAALPIAMAGLVLVGCGSGETGTASPPTTLAGVVVTTKGPPPKPSTPTACARRWNGPANASGRAAAARGAPKADAALVRAAGASGYFREDAGRCLIYLITPPRSAAVFVETARGEFSFTADASGRFSANADLRRGRRLHLR